MAEHPVRSTSRPRLYLDVPFADKGEAKVVGARWDPAEKRWFDPKPPTPGLDRWAARLPVDSEQSV